MAVPRRPTVRNHVRAVLLLPVMNAVIVPATLLWSFGDMRLGRDSIGADAIAALFALPVLVAGVSLAVRAIALFVRRGEGTLAPWDPARILITEDVYRFTRNPMKAGLFLVLIAESVLLRSTAIAIWTTCFVAANLLYVRWFEERGLRTRFGADYDAYCRRVPRWLGVTALRRKQPDRTELAS